MSFFYVRFLAIAALSAACAGCGGSGGSDEIVLNASQSKVSRLDAGIEQVEIALRLKGSVVRDEGPDVTLVLNGQTVGRAEIRNTDFETYSFKVPAWKGAADLAVVFSNNLYLHRLADRDLWIESVKVGNFSISPESAGVTYDRGSGAAAFDGVDVIAGQQRMAWSGALRLRLPSLPTAGAPAISLFTPSQAAPGSRVVISGSHLGSTTKVYFNGLAASAVEQITPYSVQVTVPPNASSGPISVETPSGRGISGTAFHVRKDEPASYARCLGSPSAHRVTDFGAFIGTASDAVARRTNTATLNRAVDKVGQLEGGGTVCLPAGSFYLTNREGGGEAILIARDNVTLWGAGMAAAKGGTRLVTRSEWNLVNGAVFRGDGLLIEGSAQESAPRLNITLRDFELDGGAGYTGKLNWPADPSNGDGWDVTHKGVVLVRDAYARNVSLSRVWVHSYRGELIYASGFGMESASFDGIRSEDTNASAFNVTSDYQVSNSYFGRSGIWVEIGAAGPHNKSVWKNNIFKDATRFGINIAQGDGATHASHSFESNTFDGCGNVEAAFYFGGGLGGPAFIRGNHILHCSGITAGRAPNDKTWANYVNQDITFEHNTLLDVPTLAHLDSNIVNSVLRHNRVVSSANTPDFTTATMICGSEISNLSISWNIFENTRTPEQTCDVVKGDRPLYLENIYLGSQSRSGPGKGTTLLNAAQRTITPMFEYAYVIVEQAGVKPQLATALYPDGQRVVVFGGTADKPLVFSTGQGSYEVASERVLTGAAGLPFVFSKTKAKWIEAR